MATNDERRRVAAELREYASFGCECEDEEELSVDCADWGERVLNLLGCGDDEGECYAALADLIEPPLQCPHYHSDRHYCSVHEDMALIDRDALLDEAKEAEKCAWYFALDHDEDELRDRLTEAAEDFSGMARRIREACGVARDE